MTEREAREQLVAAGQLLLARGLAPGTSGNLSVRLSAERYLMTPTNVSLGGLEAASISVIDAAGLHLDGPPPTKEAWLHLATYRSRPADQAIVHLHSTYSTALSCLAGSDPRDMLPPLTPYAVMRVGRVALVPYFRPGDATRGDEISALAARHRALLLANHGPVVAGPTLAAAVSIAEELEETARLYFLLEGRPHRRLTDAQVKELQRVFGDASRP
jgi:ribulose-5-phosphate 4-epimerase/fuculose-1-phosphate aldolase